VRFELFGVPRSVEESLSQIRQLAALLRRPQQGEALIARIEAAIERARPAPGARTVTAAIYQPGGNSAGSGTVLDELMEIAGLHNVAVDFGIEDYRPLSLEQLVSAPPEVLLVSDTSRRASTHAEQIVHHRALRALESQMRRALFPSRLLYCAGPTMIDALDALVDARGSL
jgi:iron complex transport system substrate-binding protein